MDRARALADSLKMPIWAAKGLLEAFYEFVAQFHPDGELCARFDLDEFVLSMDVDRGQAAVLLQALRDCGAIVCTVRTVQITDWYQAAPPKVHMKLARRRERFCTGEVPDTSRLAGSERARIEAYFDSQAQMNRAHGTNCLDEDEAASRARAHAEITSLLELDLSQERDLLFLGGGKGVEGVLGEEGGQGEPSLCADLQESCNVFELAQLTGGPLVPEVVDDLPDARDSADPLVRAFATAIMDVPKFAQYPCPDTELLGRKVIEWLDWAPGAEALLDELENWRLYNREQPKKGGSKDAVRGLHNWLVKCKGRWVLQKKRNNGYSDSNVSLEQVHKKRMAAAQKQAGGN